MSTTFDLSTLKLDELKRLADRLGIPVVSRMRKADVISVIESSSRYDPSSVMQTLHSIPSSSDLGLGGSKYFDTPAIKKTFAEFATTSAGTREFSSIRNRIEYAADVMNREVATNILESIAMALKSFTMDQLISLLYKYSVKFPGPFPEDILLLVNHYDVTIFNKFFSKTSPSMDMLIKVYQSGLTSPGVKQELEPRVSTELVRRTMESMESEESEPGVIGDAMAKLTRAIRQTTLSSSAVASSSAEAAVAVEHIVDKMLPPTTLPKRRLYSSVDVSAIDIDDFRLVDANALEKMISDAKFLESLRSSVLLHTRAKLQVFNERKIEDEREFAKIQSVRDASDATSKNRMSELSMRIKDLEEIINTLRAREMKMVSASIALKLLQKDLYAAFYDPMYGMRSIVGRETVFDQLANLIYSFSRNFRAVNGDFLNYAILGSPGTGKTRIAQVIAFVLNKAGILSKQGVRIVTRADLIGGYVGQTAPLTRRHMLDTLDGVLFIDEAYQLSDSAGKGSAHDFGSEAITEIVNFADKFAGLSSIVVAGYEDRMTNEFFASNPGLERRFPFVITLSDYTVEELTDILISMLKKRGLETSDENANVMFTFVTVLKEEGNIENNAGDMIKLSAEITRTVFGTAAGGSDIPMGVTPRAIKMGVDRYREL